LIADGVTGALPDPKLTLYNAAQSVIASNAGWASTASNQAVVTAAEALSGAFPLTDPNSKDSAVVLTLPPGGYSVEVTSASGASGNALIEVYEVP